MTQALNGGVDLGQAAELLATGEHERFIAELTQVVAERDSAQAELAQLRTMHDNQGINIAAYQAAEARYQERETKLEAKVQRQYEQMETFKREVVRVASEAAEEHNWCSVIDDILRELGLERERPTYTAELTITVSFSASRTDSRDCPERSWVRDSIRREDLEQAIRQNFEMDGDNDNVDIRDISFSIDDVEEQEA